MLELFLVFTSHPVPAPTGYGGKEGRIAIEVLLSDLIFLGFFIFGFVVLVFLHGFFVHSVSSRRFGLYFPVSFIWISFFFASLVIAS